MQKTSKNKSTPKLAIHPRLKKSRYSRIFKINANGKSKVFNVAAQNITLKNIIFVNGYSIDGGVLKNHSNNLIVENCKFKGNCALNGSAVCNPEGNLKLIDCSFDENYAFGLGGALYNYARCNIESSFLTAMS